MIKILIIKIFKLGIIALSTFFLSTCHGHKEYYEQKKIIKHQRDELELIQLKDDHNYYDQYCDTMVFKAHSYYINNRYTEAIVIINDFLHQFPANNHSSYMRYLKGLSYYKQIISIETDQESSRNSKKSFEALVNLFPDSQYSNDANDKLKQLNNILAAKEIEIGRFYLRTNKPISSINRFINIIKNYKTSIFLPEALYRLTEVYYTLGIKDEFIKYYVLLEKEYSNSTWYKKARNILF